MHLGPDGRLKRTDLWHEGTWLDLWSVVHILTGVSTALGLSILGFSFVPAALFALASFIAYEMWEAKVKIAETPQNRFMDIVVGMASYLPVSFFVAPLFQLPQSGFIFTFVLMLNAALAYVGWSASQKAAILEEKLRAEYQEQRARLRARRARRAAKRAMSRKRGRWAAQRTIPGM